MDSNQVAQTVTDVAQTAPASTNLLQDFAIFMQDGGVFMYIILVLWMVGIAISFERWRAMFSYDIDGAALMNNIKKHVLLNEVQKAIQLCSNSKALLAQVLRSGLKRANQNKEQITDAIEGSVLEVVPKVEKRMGHLAMVANLSTLLGLLGTIQGLIASFGAVAGADPSQKAKLLALGISTAMNTTALGLVSAISIMVVHQILSSKGEKIIAEIDEYSSKLVDLLQTKKSHIAVVPQDQRAEKHIHEEEKATEHVA
jgi:biopolymer transport protein ExbB/TolQ